MRNVKNIQEPPGFYKLLYIQGISVSEAVGFFGGWGAPRPPLSTGPLPPPSTPTDQAPHSPTAQQPRPHSPGWKDRPVGPRT